MEEYGIGGMLRSLGISAVIAGLLAIAISWFYAKSAFETFSVVFPLVAIVLYSYRAVCRARREM